MIDSEKALERWYVRHQCVHCLTKAVCSCLLRRDRAVDSQNRQNAVASYHELSFIYHNITQFYL